MLSTSLSPEEIADAIWMLDNIQALKLVERYKRAPLAFFLERLRTFDPKGPPDKRSARPTDCTEGLKALTERWQLHIDLDIPKSRQVFCSWGCCQCGFHELLFHSGTTGIIVSETDKKSQELVYRFQYMWDHLDDGQEVPLKHLWEVEPLTETFTVTKFMDKPWGSEVRALSQNPHAVRQYSGSWAWIDEAGVQMRFVEMIKAIGPAVDRLYTTGTLEANEAYTDRCGYEVLRDFEGAELGDYEAADELSGMSSKEVFVLEDEVR